MNFPLFLKNAYFCTDSMSPTAKPTCENQEANKNVKCEKVTSYSQKLWASMDKISAPCCTIATRKRHYEHNGRGMLARY